MIGAVIVHAPSGNVGSALSRRKGEKNVGSGTAVASGNIVGAAQAVIQFNQKLVGCVALLGRRNKIPGGIIQIRQREKIEYGGTRRGHGDGYWISVRVGEFTGALGQRGNVRDTCNAGKTPESFVIQEK